jgi:ATPase subunit of ABC transporter with duplicated ATPase domains
MSTRAAITSMLEERLGGDLGRARLHEDQRPRQSTRAYVGAFNFKGQDQQKNVGKLSGGERNRVNIAKMLKRGGNVLCSTSRPTT